MNFADAYGRAQIRGFYEYRVVEIFFDEFRAAFGIGFPLGAEQVDVRGLGKACCGEKLLHSRLVHAGGGAENTGANIRYISEFQESLNGAVFAEGAVEHGEDYVERLSERAVLLGEFGACGEL